VKKKATKVKKVKPKKVKPKKVKKLRITDRGVPVTGLFDEDSDWRLKQVHLNANQVKKALYDLSINVEGEHDHIHKTIQRCHDRIEHVEGLILGLSGKVEQLNEATLNLNLIIENLVAKIIETKRKHTPYDWKPKQGWQTSTHSEIFGAKEKADAEWKIREALKDMDNGIDPNKKDDDDDLR
tara:strand:- start:180 stop:725 length:546 start_codon:yes stop_codon:yes gene_type:complete